MARGTATLLQETAHHRIADVLVSIDDRHEILDFLRAEDVGIDAVQANGMYPTRHLAKLVLGMGDGENAALAEHHIEVQVLRHAFPQLHRVLVDGGRLVPQIVRADDGGVPAGVAAAEPSLFDDSDALDAVNRRQRIGRGEPVAAAADDHDVIFGLRRRVSPGALPVLMIVHCFLGQGESGIFLLAARQATKAAIWLVCCHDTSPGLENVGSDAGSRCRAGTMGS